jgi:hypothetical protein
VSDYAHQGLANATTDHSEINSLAFFVQRFLAEVPGSALVQVVAVTNTPGQLAPIGKVHVIPLVNQVTDEGSPTPHGTVHSIPYMRLQGGKNAILADPQVNDIGLAVIMSRDHSSVIANSPSGNTGNAQSNPGSSRQNSWSDGIYLGSMLGPTPNQYIGFTATGLIMGDMHGNTLTTDASGWHINGALINTSGDVITKAGHDLDTHTHSGVTTGSGDTGPPV